MTDENPLRALLGLKESRQARELLSATLVVFVGYGLYWSDPLGRDTLGLVVLLGCVWMFHLVVLPALVRPPDCTLLLTLRRGGCVEELAGADLPPSTVVDTLATQALANRVSWWVVGLGGLAALGLVGDPPGDGARLRWAGFALSLLLYPALRVVGSYAAQVLAAWSREGERVTLAQLLATGVLHGVANVLVVVGLVDLFERSWLSGTAWLLAAMAWLVLVSRGLALAALRRPELPSAARSRRPRRMPEWLHPVLAREWLRDSAALPGGVPTLLALNLLSLPVLGLWLGGGGASLMSRAPAEVVLVDLPLLGLLVVGALRAASRTLDACLREREQRTLDLVATTRMTPAEWLDGLAMLGWLPRVLEVFAALALLVPAWLSAGLPVGPPLVTGLAVAAAMPLAAWFAVLCVPAGTNRREAALLAYLCLLGILWFGALMAMSLEVSGHLVAATMVAATVACATMGVRAAALRAPLQSGRGSC